MTAESPQVPLAEYHLEQFIKHTVPDQRAVFLEEYDLLEPNDTQPKGLTDRYKVESDVEPSDEFEEIAVNEAEKRGVNVVDVTTEEVGRDDPDVVKRVVLSVEVDGVVAEFRLVKERADHVDVEPVTKDWYRQAVESILRYNYEYEVNDE